MADTISRLAIQVGMDTAALRRGVSDASTIIGGMGARLTGALAAITGGLTAGGIAGFGVKLAAEMETASVAFEVMIGDARRAQRLFTELRDFAVATPFEFPELRDASRTLLAMGIAADDVMSTIKVLGDVSAGTNQPLNEMASLFGQVAVAGRLTGNELRQFNERGIPLMDALAQRFGVTKAEIRAMVEAGKIGFVDVQAALQSLTGEGGRFFDLMGRKSQALAGRFSTLSDTAKLAAANFGAALFPALSKLIEAAIPLAHALANIDVATLQNIIKIGAWSTALAGAAIIIPRVASAITSMAAALRTAVQWQAVMTALQGPKGWATLAVSLGVAVGAAYALDQAFADAGTAGQEAAKATGEAWRSQVTGELYTFSQKISEQQKEIERQMAEGEAKNKERQSAFTTRGKQLSESLRTPMEEYSDALREANDLLQAGAISEVIYSRAVAKAREELESKGKEADRTADKLRRMNEAGRATPSAIVAGTQGAQTALAQRANAEMARQTAILEKISQQLANAPVIQKARL